MKNYRRNVLPNSLINKFFEKNCWRKGGRHHFETVTLPVKCISNNQKYIPILLLNASPKMPPNILNINYDI